MNSQLQKTTNGFYRPFKTRIIKSALISISILALIAACTRGPGPDPLDNAIDCSGAAKTFSTDVKPIVQAVCNACHGVGSNNGPGELISYSQIFNARFSIRSAVLSGAMPQNGSLTNAQKSSIVCWIDSGAPNN